MTEYEKYLDELEWHRQQKEKAECYQGNHNWQHFYKFARCGTCGETMTTNTPFNEDI